MVKTNKMLSLDHLALENWSKHFDSLSDRVESMLIKDVEDEQKRVNSSKETVKSFDFNQTKQKYPKLYIKAHQEGYYYFKGIAMPPFKFSPNTHPEHFDWMVLKFKEKIAEFESKKKE